MAEEGNARNAAELFPREELRMGVLWSYAAFLLGAIVLLVWFVALFLRRAPFSGGFRGYLKVVWFKWRGWGLTVLCFLMSVALFLPVPASVRESDRVKRCKNNLAQIAEALRCYRAAHGRYPPAYVADKDGRPLYSWRVLLLPYLDCDTMYEDLHLDEPWDSPHNRRVCDVPRHVYSCPSEHRVGTETSYVMVVGPGTISDGPNAAQLEDIRDGTANTIAIVEMSDSGIHWAEPRDLKADEMSYRINDPDRPCIRSRHNGVAQVAFGDGSVRLLPNDVPAELVKALTTIAGGEDVRKFWEDY